MTTDRGAGMQGGEQRLGLPAATEECKNEMADRIACYASVLCAGLKVSFVASRRTAIAPKPAWVGILPWVGPSVERFRY